MYGIAWAIFAFTSPFPLREMHRYTNKLQNHSQQNQAFSLRHDQQSSKNAGLPLSGASFSIEKFLDT
jgi:hypothetical protein